MTRFYPALAFHTGLWPSCREEGDDDESIAQSSPYIRTPVVGTLWNKAEPRWLAAAPLQDITAWEIRLDPRSHCGDFFKNTSDIDAFTGSTLTLCPSFSAMAPRPSLPPSAKKRKLTDTKTEDDVALSIHALELQLTTAVANKTSLNPLADLLDLARNATDAAVLSKAIYALYRVFVLIVSANLLYGPIADEKGKAVRTWLHERLQTYTQLLVGLLKDDETTLRVRMFTPTLRCEMTHSM